MPSAVAAELKELQRQNAELRRANEALIVAYIDAFRHRFGVEPICRVLSEHDMAIAPSTYYAHRAEPVSQADWDDAHMANVALELWRANRSLRMYCVASARVRHRGGMQ